jgi:hypothetical protein
LTQDEEQWCSRTASVALVFLLVFIGGLGIANGQTKPTGGASPAASGAAVYFVDLKDGQTVPTKFTVHFGLKGMGVAPAGFDENHVPHRPANLLRSHTGCGDGHRPDTAATEAETSLSVLRIRLNCSTSGSSGG